MGQGNTALKGVGGGDFCGGANVHLSWDEEWMCSGEVILSNGLGSFVKEVDQGQGYGLEHYLMEFELNRLIISIVIKIIVSGNIFSGQVVRNNNNVIKVARRGWVFKAFYITGNKEFIGVKIK